MIRQNAVLDRSEQRANHSEQEQRQKQQQQRVQLEAGDSDRRGADLGELEAARHRRLIEAIRELSVQRPTAEKRRDKDAPRQGHEHLACLTADPEQDQQDERVLQKIVVEGGKELASEQRRKTPGREQ
jgi:hypothetical protein